jgi:hypothetical protein
MSENGFAQFIAMFIAKMIVIGYGGTRNTKNDQTLAALTGETKGFGPYPAILCFLVIRASTWMSKPHVAQILRRTQIGTRQKTSMIAQQNAALNTTMIFKTHLWGFGVPCHISLWIQTMSEKVLKVLLKL